MVFDSFGELEFHHSPGYPSLEMDKPKNGCSKTRHQMHTTLLCAWQQLAASKMCFQMLKQDLLKGMAEANDIFNSMSIPLVRLVGLKMEELSAEGRQTSVSVSPLISEILQARSPAPALCSESVIKRSEVWQSAISRPAGQWSNGYKEENMKTKAARHVAEFSLLQKQQLRQLVGVVKMVEKLVRSQEVAIADRFQDCENYLESLQQSSLVNFKNLHQQVVDMRQQDSRIAYRLRVAEQSYQALMSLAVKLQESGINKVRRNLLDVKADVEGMVNELASSMCKPLIAFLKELKADHGAAMAVSKLQSLIEEVESKSSADFQTLSAANDEVKAHVKKIEFQLQAQSREMETMSREGEAMSISLEEKIGDLKALRKALAEKTEEGKELKARLDCETARACRREEVLRQKEAKLADATELLQATKRQLTHEHFQMAEACVKSKELCSQLSGVEHRLSQTKTALENYHVSSEARLDCSAADMTKKIQLAQLQSPSEQQPASLKGFLQEVGKNEYWLLLCRQISQILPDGMAEMQSDCLEKGPLHEAVALVKENYDNQERSGVREENLPNTSQLLQEQVMESVVSWMSQVKGIQVLIQNAAQHSEESFLSELICIYNATRCEREVKANLTNSTRAELSSVTLGFWLPLLLHLTQYSNTCRRLDPPDYGTSTITVCSDLVQASSQKLKDLVSELQVRVLALNKSSGSLGQLLVTAAMAKLFENEYAGSQTEPHRNGIEALSQQQQQKRDLIEDGDHKRKLLKYDLSSESASPVEGPSRNKRSMSSCHCVGQEESSALVQFSAKRMHTCEGVGNPNPQLHVQRSLLNSVIKHQTLEGKNGIKSHSPLVTIDGQNGLKSQSNLVTIEGKNTLLTVEGKNGIKRQSTLFALEGKNGIKNHSTLVTLEGKNGIQNHSAKELWQVLELGPDNSSTSTDCYKRSGSIAPETNLTTARSSQQYDSEPLLVLREEVPRRTRAFSNRASPRLLARRLAHNPCPSYR